MTKYVYSTLSSGMTYTITKKGKNDMPIIDGRIEIDGGANVADKKTFVTPRGVVTKITDEQYEALQQNPVFKRHVKKGYIQVSDAKVDAEVAAADMTSRDESAQLVEQDFAEGKAPATGKASKKGKGE